MLLRKVIIENFRGFKRLQIDLEPTTVIIGENNTGKTSILEAIQLCLGKTPSRKSNYFQDYDYHLSSSNAKPGDAGILSITLDFSEVYEEEWNDEIIQVLSDIITFDNNNLRHVRLRITSGYSASINDFVPDWKFLDSAGNELRGIKFQTLGALLQLRPLFFLPASRDVSKEFSTRSDIWTSFLQNFSMPDSTRELLERKLTEFNQEVLESQPSLQVLREKLEQMQNFVALGQQNIVSIAALPGRVWENLSKAQINIAGTTGANLPLSRHGHGLQSVAVIFLFEAYFASILGHKYEELSKPILMFEEPEAHLHPCAARALWSTLNTLDGQKVISSHSGDLLAVVPLKAIRRLCYINGQIEVRKIEVDDLSSENIRLLNYHLRSMRGELFFARCWLLVEGPSDVCILSEVARMLKIDLECHGIRIVAYRNANASIFAKVANNLGIEWHCVVDGDRSGQTTALSLHQYFGNRSEKERISVIMPKNLEVFLCTKGYGHLYLKYVSEQKPLTAKPDDPDYWEKVIEALPKKFHKESVILEVIAEMENNLSSQGQQAIPSELQKIISVTQLDFVHFQFNNRRQKPVGQAW